jgi:hypothetical protein
MNFNELEDQIESAIRNGNRTQARALFKELKGQSFPRPRAKSFANLARRCGLLPLALQILQPVVRPRVAGGERPTPEESAAYALVLIGLGAGAEGLKLLKDADSENAEVILAQAFAATKSWDYKTAATLLTKYEGCSGLTDYQRMTASVNLAASQIALGQHAEASTRINSILVETRSLQWNLLHKNALELATQLAILCSDWETFDSITKIKEPKQESEFNLDDFFISKWKAIAELNRSKGSAASVSLLEKVRAQALTNQHSETVRDCDFHRAIVTQDRKLALHVYFGTPFESFRLRVLAATSDWLIVPESYTWNLAEGRRLKSKVSRVFDLDEGCEIGSTIETPKGRSLHLALRVLCSDFYRPFQMGSLLGSMYPDEHINPHSSPKRVAYLMHRLRRWFEEGDIPLQIVNDGNGYRLKSEKPYGIQISHPRTDPNTGRDVAKVLMFEKFQAEIKDLKFSIHDVAKRLAISERSARYFLTWAANLNLIERVGTGRITHYRLR